MNLIGRKALLKNCWIINAVILAQGLLLTPDLIAAVRLVEDEISLLAKSLPRRTHIVRFTF